MLLEKKRIIRKQISAVRDSYQKAWLEKNSKTVSGHLAEWTHFQAARKIFGYLAFGNEVDIDEVLHSALMQGKDVYIPYIAAEDNIMRLVRFKSFDEIVTGRYGIRTIKDPEFLLCPNEIDLVLTPGLSFTKSGGRMGLGKGYYDRFLAQAKAAIKIGVTLTPQIVENLPLESHDVMVDFLVTEEGIEACNR